LRSSFFVLVALLSLGATGCDDRQSKAEAPPAYVNTVVVEARQSSRLLSLTGEIQARTTSDLSFRTGGRIIERTVDVGDHVTRGDVLARLDPSQQQADVSNAEAAVAAAEAAYRQSAADFERQRTLLDKGFTTKSGFDDAEKVVRTAEGTLEAARASREIARTTLDYTELRADADGIVVARFANVGEIAQPAKPVLTVALDGPRDAVLDVYEQVFLNSPLPSVALVRLVADPDVTATGRVREVSPTVETATGTVRVKVDIGVPPAGMTLGAPVVVEVNGSESLSINIPASALTMTAGRAAVWVVGADAKVALRPIEAASFGADTVLVQSGLKPGERVVIDGGKLLAPGEVVVPLEEPVQ
jgi:RND family efflux transporter MFP subunit